MHDLTVRRSPDEEIEATAVEGALGEGRRNRLLRRVDWRFLLENIHPARTICFTGGSIAEAVRLISPDVADKAEPADPPRDLAVAMDPDERTIRDAFRGLEPGGSFYAEWRLRRNRDPRSIRRKLISAGFEDVVLYWPRPDPEVASAAIWLPIESREALRFYLDNRPPARNTVRRLARAIRRVFFLPRPRFKLANPVCSIARRGRTDPGERIRTAGDSAVENSSAILPGIREHWPQWNLGNTPERLTSILITRGLRASGKAVALVFADSRRQPTLAVKMARIPESARVLRREASILEALQAYPAIRDSIPRVLWSGEVSSAGRLVETAIRGLPAFVAVNRQNFREIASKAAQWLVRLAGRPQPRARSDWWRRLAEPALTEFENHFGSVLPPDFPGECRRILESLGPLPLVWEQRDFSPWNVFVDSAGEISAVDWESAEPDGFPLLDLVYFLTYLSFSLDQARRTGRFLDSYRAFLDPGSFTGRIAAECMDRYSETLGLVRTARRPLRVMTWLLHLRSEYAQLAGDACGSPSPEALRQALFLRLLEEEVRGGVRV